MTELAVGSNVNGVTIDGAMAGDGRVKIETLDGSTVLGLNGANVTLENLIITQIAQLWGTDTAVGGLDIVGGTVSLNNFRITNNPARETNPTETAGGIKVSGGADVTATDSQIDDNIALSGGSGVNGFNSVGGVLVDGGTGVGGLLIEGGGTVTANHATIYNNGGHGGLGGAGVTAVRGGIGGGRGGYGIGGVYADNGSITAYSSSVTDNDGTGGIGGHGGSPVGYSGRNSGPGERGSGGGAGGIGRAVMTYGSGSFSAYALDLSGNHGHGGVGGSGGVGGTGVTPGTLVAGPSGGGYGAAAGLAGSTGHPGSGGAFGGASGLPGQSGSADYDPQVFNGIYSGGGGGSGSFITETTGTILSIACFAAGTRIAVPSGTCAVETLRAGQMVLTQDGTTVPIK